MQIIPLAHDFPSKHITFSGLLVVLVGLFTFIISCVYVSGNLFIGTLICCLFLTIIGVLLILTGLYVLKPIVDNTSIQLVLIIFGECFAFISFCLFCTIADALRVVLDWTYGITHSQLETILALSIISVLLLLLVMLTLGLLLYIVYRCHTHAIHTTTTTATHTKTVTTTIETPPARA